METLREIQSGKTNKVSILGKLTQEDMASLVAGLADAAHVTEICFTYNALTAQDIKKLSAVFSKMIKIEILSNSLQVDAVNFLMQACQLGGKIQSLTLMGCDIDDACLEEISRFLITQTCTLEILNIAGNASISQQGLTSLKNALSKNTSVLELNFSSILAHDLEISIRALVSANIECRQWRKAVDLSSATPVPIDWRSVLLAFKQQQSTQHPSRINTIADELIGKNSFPAL